MGSKGRKADSSNAGRRTLGIGREPWRRIGNAQQSRRPGQGAGKATYRQRIGDPPEQHAGTPPKHATLVKT